MRTLFLIQDGNGVQHFGSIGSPEHLRRDLSKMTGSAHTLWLAASTPEVNLGQIEESLDNKFTYNRIAEGKYRAEPTKIVRHLVWLCHIKPRITRPYRKARRTALSPLKRLKWRLMQALAF